MYDQELLTIVIALKKQRYYYDGSTYTIKILTNYNNLRGFIALKSLILRQSQQSLVLATYDFIIQYRSGITNPANAPLRRPDYVDESQVENLLLILQWKLVRVTLISLSIGINSIQCDLDKALLRYRSKELKTSVISISNSNTPRDKTLESSSVKAHAYYSINNVVGNTSYKQSLLRLLVYSILLGKTAYDLLSTTAIYLIKELQAKYSFI